MRWISTPLFYYDSGAFLATALGLGIRPERSYVYAGLIRTFAVPFHSLRAIVAMQLVMGACTAWLLALILIRCLKLRAWIAMLTASIFALDPMQILYEHMIMTETTALLAMAIFLFVALYYLHKPDWWLLAAVSLLGALLVSLRIVYLPVVLISAVLLPLAAYFSGPRRPRALALSLAVSCGATMLFQFGYRHLTGQLAGREPAYHYKTGFFLVAAAAPIVESRDSADKRVAEAVAEQNKSNLPLSDVDSRFKQLWYPEGLVARITSALGGDARAADQAAASVARAAILRNPLGFLRLGLYNYVTYWRKIPVLIWVLPWENGSPPEPVLNARYLELIRSGFDADVSKQHLLRTRSRRYQIRGRNWCVFLLAAPFLGAIALWRCPRNQKAQVALLLVWGCLLLTASCLGALESAYRYLHPFSFTGLAAVAVLAAAICRSASAPLHKAIGVRMGPFSRV